MQEAGDRKKAEFRMNRRIDIDMEELTMDQAELNEEKINAENPGTAGHFPTEGEAGEATSPGPQPRKYKIHSIRYNALMSLILKMSGFLFPLLTLPYMTRILHTESYGRVSFVDSVIVYFTLAASLGIPSYGVRACAMVRDDEQRLARTAKELLILNIISMVIMYAVFVGCVLGIPRFREDQSLLMVSSLAVILQTFGMEWFFQAIEQYGYMTVRNLCFKVVYILLLVLFVRSPRDCMQYCAVTVFGTAGYNLVNVLRIRKLINLRQKTPIELKPHLKPVLLLFFYYAATTIYTNMDMVMLGFLTNSRVVGNYAVALKIQHLLASAVTVLGAVALPRVSYFLAHGQKEEFRQLIRKSLSCVLLLSVPLAVYFNMEAKPVIMILAGVRFRDAISSLRWIVPSVIFIGLSSVTAWQILVPMEKDKVTVVGAVGGAVLDCILNLLLIPKYGAVGAAIGTLCAEAFVLLVHVVYLRGLIWKALDLTEVLKIAASTLISAGLLHIMNLNFTSSHNSVICIGTAILFFGTYGVCCLLMQEKLVMEAIRVVAEWVVRLHEME